METGDSSSSLRQDDRQDMQESCETQLLDEVLERGIGVGSNGEDDPTDSGLKMDAGQKETVAQPSVMNVSATGGASANGIPCKECSVSFASLQAYMEHRCPNARRLLPLAGIGSEVSDLEDSDVEAFDGEIVYQPNGSAFIIKEPKENVQNSPPGLHALLSPSGLLSRQTCVPFFPQVINTFHIASSSRGQLAADPTSPNTSSLAGIGPVLHSFRVYDLRHKGDQDCRTGDSTSKNSCISKDVPNGLDLSRFDGFVKDGKNKPVLMCFLCRMSFGYVRSFVNHAIQDHRMSLNKEEQKVLTNKYISAIIQGIGQDREPLISFLEPKKPLCLTPLFSASDPICPDPSLGVLWSALQAESGASMLAVFPSVKGTVASESPEEESAMSKAEVNLQALSPSVSSLPQGCLLSGTAGESLDSDSLRKMEGSKSDLHVERSIKSELTDTEEDGGIYYSESEEDSNDCISKQADFSAGKDYPLSNQSNSLLASSSLKSEVKGTPYFSTTISANRAITKQVAALQDQNSDADGQSRSEMEYLKSQEDAISLSLDEQRLSDRSPIPPHYQVSGKHSTMLDSERGSPSSDIKYPKCDTDLGSSQAQSNHTVTLQSGMPCKALKCPMCNWHYKYQQSLDAHLKEKHPEMGSACPYCGTGQPHPRLSRGESHTCGYKPFHCEVCNYSTTTKGNLTIHMQSDRHLTNVHVLQNGNTDVSDGRSTHTLPISGIGGRMPSPTKPKQRSSWRCEVCDYETSVAHNLRIHMTSEKHVHNIMLLQQTLKQMRSGLQPGVVPAEAQLYQYYLAQNMGLPGLKLENPTDIPHMMVNPFQCSPFSSTGLIPGLVNDDLSKDISLAGCQPKSDEQPLLSVGELSAHIGDPPQKMYQCSLCSRFASDSLEALSLHVSEERVLPLEDWRTIIDDHYQCRLCGYRTQLRANFLLHCQTDRHLHRYQLAAHLKEAGEPNYWRLKDVAISNPVHLKCNLCDYHSNSVEKLRLHTANQRHEAAMRLYKHLQKQESMLNSTSCYFYCALCDYSTKAKLHLVQHLLSAKHQQALGSHKLEFFQRGLGSEADALGDLFYVKDRPKKESEDEKIKGPAKITTNDFIEKDIKANKKTKPGFNTLSEEPPGTTTLGKRTLLPENGNDTTPKRLKSAEETGSSEQNNQCSQCSYSTPDPNRMAMHVLSQHSMRLALCCPLCDDILSSKIHLQLHLTHLHSVAADCVEKLITSVSETNVLIPRNMAEKLPEPVKDKLLGHMDTSPVTQKESVKPQVSGGGSMASKSKAQNKGLEGLQNILEVKPLKKPSDTPSWKKSQDQKSQSCSWKDQSGVQNQQFIGSSHHGYKQRSDHCSLETRELQSHSELCTTIVCALCLCDFQTVLELRKHLQSCHPELSEADIERLCRTPTVNELSNENEERISEVKLLKDLIQERKDSPPRSDSGSPLDEVNPEPRRSVPLRKGTNFFVEKFLDPARPYKCTVCKESFTQKNILLVHYNSVSHLHKLKKVMCETTSPVLQESSNRFDNKPYKCNICNVAYSQSSTLEIHMRSVLHQTKARTSKVETGSSISNGNCQATLPQRPVSISQETIDSSLPGANPKDNLTKAKETNRKQTTENISTLLPPQPQLQLQHDLTQQAAFFQSQFLSPTFWPPLPVSPSVLLHFQQPQFLFPFYVPGAEVKLNPEVVSQSPILGLPGMTQSLLEDLRLQQSQFQQLQQQAMKKLTSDSEVQPQKEQEPVNEPANEVEQKDKATSDIQTSEDTEEQSKKPESKEEPEKLNHSSIATDDNGDGKKQAPEPSFLPPRVILGARGNAARALLENFGFELVIQYIENRQRNQRKNECAEKETVADKLECGTCGKLFSNILILKNHQEHVHRQIFPNGDLEKFAQQYREAYDKLYPINLLSPVTPPSPPTTPSLPPPPSSPQPPSETASTIRKMQTPVPPKTPQPPPTPPPPPLPVVSPQIHFPTSGDLPLLLSMMARQAGMPPNVTTQLPASDSTLQSDLTQPCRQQEPDPGFLQRVESKRPRTRITDEQLKILRDNFKVNNYPGEEKVQELAEKSGLCQKVIKHWFRNALFKERQRCKDSPYNFSIPPVTTLEDMKLETQCDGMDFYKLDPAMGDQSSRTHFTDHQMRVLQDYFNTNANPKDYEINQLSSVLNLPSHAIIVWFQNSREKVRKNDESQRDSTADSERKEICNESCNAYSCIHNAQDNDWQDKECGDVGNQNVPKVLEHVGSSKHAFGRGTFSDSSSPSEPSPQSSVGKVSPKPKLTSENPRQVEDSSSEVINNIPDLRAAQVLTPQPARQKEPQELMTRLQSAAITSSHLPLTSSSLTNSLLPQMLHFKCDQCKIIFPSAELWQEHQRMHLLATQNQFLHPQFLERSLEMPYMIFDPSNPVIASQLLSGTFSQMSVLNSSVHSSPPSSCSASLKRKLDDREDNSSSDKDSGNAIEDQQRDKRPRTTIAPEQLEILYDKYLLDSNPTRKMLEHIASTVGLKKRVVQVWFQNTRARERKGQFRALGTAQSNKKCPFCGSLFKALSALENHIRSRHLHEAKEAGFSLYLSSMMLGNDGEEILHKHNDYENKFTKMETSESEFPEYEMMAASSSPAKPSEGHMKYLISSPCSKAEKNEDTEGTSVNSGEVFYDLSKTDLDETSSVTTATSDASTGHRGQSEQGEGKINPFQNYDSHREVQNNPANFSIQESTHMYSVQGDDLDDSTDQSETLSIVDLSSPHPFTYRSPLEHGRLSADKPGHRRSRTQMSNQQVMVLKSCFSDCRTPTMHECETLGNKIGLAKRVVQVWFQNARAKEKKFKITVGKPFVISQESPDGLMPECTLCGTRFTTTFPIREHIFSKLHIDKLRDRLRGHVDREKDHLTATTVRQLMAQQEFERFKKRTGTTAQQQTVTDGSALLGLGWPTSYSGITGLPSGVNGHLKLPSFPPNTPGPPDDPFPSPITPTTAVSLSCTPTKTPATPPPVLSTPSTSLQTEPLNLDKPKMSVQPKQQHEEKETNGSRFGLKKRKEGERERRTKRAKSQGLLSTVAGDPGTFLAGQFLPYFVPGLVPYLPPQLPGFAQGGSFPPLCGLENLFPYGPGLPQAIAGLSTAALVQQCKQYQQSLPDTLKQEKLSEGQRQKPVPNEPLNTPGDGVHPTEEDSTSFSAESTDQELLAGATNTDCPDSLNTSSSKGEFTCEKCQMVFTNKESALHHKKESCCFGQSFSNLQEAELRKAASSKYNCTVKNLTISMDKGLGRHARLSPHKDKAARQAMRDAKEHTRLLPRSASSSTTSTSQSAINNRPHISCTSMASWPSVLFQASSMSPASFLSPSVSLPSPLSTPPLVTSSARGTSESRLSLPAEMCSDKLGGQLSQKLDNFGKSLDIKTKSTSGLGANFRSVRMDMFTV